MVSQQAPIPPNEKERLKALLSLDILDTEAEEQFDRLTRLASEICEVPISLVSLVDGERQWFKSRVGLDAEQTPREISFCQHAIMHENTFEIQNATLDDRFQSNVLVTGDPNIRFYAGHPLFDDNGYALGTLCVIDRKPKKLNEFQTRALEILAKEVVSAIKSRKDKKVLNEYKRFFDMSLDFMCIAKTDGFFKILNPNFTNQLGYSTEELLAVPFVEFVHPDDIESTINETKKLAEGHSTIGFVNRYLKKNGDYIHLHWTCQPDPETGELFAVAHDITDLKEIERKLKKSNEQLDQFAYIVSHDLKAPLRAIATLSTFIEEDLGSALTGEISETFALLKSRVSRMEALINGILDYSRVGRKTEELELVNMSELLDELLDSILPETKFTVNIQDNFPDVMYSRVQLNQVFQNIISNAVKYHHHDSGVIDVSWKEIKGFYEFTVKDDGPGIAPAYHEKVFGIFHTLQSRDEIESTGIGLSIVKKIIEEHGGTIHIESEEGKGSSFIFTIPAK